MGNITNIICFWWMAIGVCWFVSMMVYVTYQKKRIKEGFLLLCVFGWPFTVGGWIWSKFSKKPNRLSPFLLIVDQ